MMLLTLLFSFAHALRCEGVPASEMHDLVRSRGLVHFGDQLRLGTKTCTGVRDTPAFYFDAHRMSVIFFECRAGQAWYDPDDDVGGVSCGRDDQNG